MEDGVTSTKTHSGLTERGFTMSMNRERLVMESPAFWYAVKMIAEGNAVFVLDGVRIKLDDKRAEKIMDGSHVVKYVKFRTDPIEIVVVKEAR